MKPAWAGMWGQRITEPWNGWGGGDLKPRAALAGTHQAVGQGDGAGCGLSFLLALDFV